MAQIIHDASTRDTAGKANLAADEERILRFLGAAVVVQWNTLPTKLQRELLDTAASLGDLVDPFIFRGKSRASCIDSRLNGIRGRGSPPGARATIVCGLSRSTRRNALPRA